jgi:uncharacterized repeat protein (TIGR02543 family)
MNARRSARTLALVLLAITALASCSNLLQEALKADTAFVAQDHAALLIGYAGSDTEAAISQSITLPTTNAAGTTITWTSDNSAVISTSGSVTRPAFDAAAVDGGAVLVTLTASLQSGGATSTKTFKVTVLAVPPTDDQAVAADKAALLVGYVTGDGVSSITQNLSLPITGRWGSSIIWTSDNLPVIAANGVVTRPSLASGDATVELTAAIAKNAANAPKTFSSLIVKCFSGITFNANGGTGGSMSPQTIATDATAALTVNAFTRAGYDFAGWATSAGGTVAYANGASYTMGTASVTLYAKWIDNSLPAAPLVTVASPTTNTSPTWSWTLHVSATSYRYKLDGNGEWIESPATVNPLYTPAAPLSLGNHTLEVQQQVSGVWSGSGTATAAIVLLATAPTTTFTSSDYTDTTPEWTWDGPATVTSFRYRLIVCEDSASEWAKPASLPAWVEVASTTKAYASPVVELWANYAEPASAVVVLEVQQMIDSVWSESAENVVYILKADIDIGAMNVYAGSNVSYRKDASTSTGLFDLMTSVGAKYYFSITSATSSGMVWGSGLYTNDSAIGPAAIHAGKIAAGGTGIVKLKFAYGASSYTGSTAYGITTVLYGSWPGSYIFLD